MVLLVAPQIYALRLAHEDAAGVRPIATEARGQAKPGVRLREQHACTSQAPLLVARHAAGPRGEALGVPQGQIRSAEHRWSAARTGRLQGGVEDALHLPPFRLGAARREAEGAEVPPRLHSRVDRVAARGVDPRVRQLRGVVIFGMGHLGCPTRVQGFHERAEELRVRFVALGVTGVDARNFHELVPRAVDAWLQALRERDAQGGAAVPQAFVKRPV
mmetsp:Transcript_122084/g.350741  ORF Transcript_122084/g.350741 Transcript_122084/m.350741 type:complete len:217 (-) Transcript_122084:647-1297(-)